jgi:hypothetical protein
MKFRHLAPYSKKRIGFLQIGFCRRAGSVSGLTYCFVDLLMFMPTFTFLETLWFTRVLLSSLYTLLATCPFGNRSRPHLLIVFLPIASYNISSCDPVAAKTCLSLGRRSTYPCPRSHIGKLHCIVLTVYRTTTL